MPDQYPFKQPPDATPEICEKLGVLLARDMIEATISQDEQLPIYRTNARIGAAALVQSRLFTEYTESTPTFNALSGVASRRYGVPGPIPTAWEPQQWRRFEREKFAAMPKSIKNWSSLLWHISSERSRFEMIVDYQRFLKIDI